MAGVLDGRRIFVTGAAGGIGRACIARFVDAGARVGCLDRDETALAAVEEQHGRDRVSVCAADISDPEDVTRQVDRFHDWATGLDGIVNAAGTDLVSPVEDMSDADWRRVMAINLDGPMQVCRAAVRHMSNAGGGSIVNISSGAGLQPLAGRSAYSASKAGLQMFSKVLAMEGAEHGIRVNCVCPGAVDTPLFRDGIAAADDPETEYANVLARYALRRIAQPDEIASAVFWLISSESSYVTGTAIAVDGGRTFH